MSSCDAMPVYITHHRMILSGVYRTSDFVIEHRGIELLCRTILLLDAPQLQVWLALA